MIRRSPWLALALVAATPALAVADDGIGIDPGRPRIAEPRVTPEDEGGADEGDDDDEDDGYRFEYHGFFRIPMRVGHGGSDGFATDVDKGTKLHSPPQIPDEAYTDWRFTNNLPGPWTELWLAYGNGQVSANIVIAAYNVTDAGYKDLVSQLGIDQAFLTIRWPTLFGAKGGVTLNVGGFTNRYGTAGRYDAGKYDTYLFGSTHVAGETVKADYKVGKDLVLHGEHGVGVKLAAPPLVAGLPETPFLPYPGDVQQGTTLLHHAHAGVTWKNVTGAVHYLTAWTDDARQTGEIDGRITSMGAELKLVDSKWGDGFLGYGLLLSRDPLRVGGALEVMHSFAGWELRDNYFGSTYEELDAEATGSGTIHSVLFEHTFSLARYLWDPEPFWGQGPDLTFSVFGLYNHVTSDDAAFAGAPDKLKVGADVVYSMKKWLAFATRYDVVQPNFDDSEQSFQVITPRLILRSNFASHEEVSIQYSRYVNGDHVRPGWPNEALTPDRGVLAITALMWW